MTRIWISVLASAACGAALAGPACAQSGAWEKAARQFGKRMERAGMQNGLERTERVLQARARRAQAVNRAFERRAVSPEAADLGYEYFRVLKPDPLLKLPPLTRGIDWERAGWIYENNLHVVAERAVMERTLRLLSRHQKELEAALHIDRNPGLPGIAEHAKYVFLGELHHEPYVRDLILDMIFNYRAAHRGRQIIVLTEFAPDQGLSFVRDFSNPQYEEYRGFLTELASVQIPVAGLEEPATLADERTFESDGQAKSVQTTPEGMRQRNLHWLARIRAWREKYPDAVFFIYAGGSHTDYNTPFSISARLPAEETFVFGVHSAQAPSRKPFHAVTGNRFAVPGALLTWQDPRWARLAGFDAAFILP